MVDVCVSLSLWRELTGGEFLSHYTCLISCFGASDSKEVSKTKIVPPGKAPGQYVCLSVSVIPAPCSVSPVCFVDIFNDKPLFSVYFQIISIRYPWSLY